MADTTFDEELDLVPGLKYLKNKFVSVSPAPSSFDSAKAIPFPKVDLERLNPDLRERIDIASRDWMGNKELNPKGEAFPITSGFRETPKQAQLFAQRGTNPNLVAPPGYSTHEKGMGVDILPHVPDTFLSTYGLHRPYGSKDPVHVEINKSAPWARADMEFTNDEGVDVPGAQYTTRQGVYQPSTREAIGSQFEGIKNDLTSSDYYTKTLPKQAAALGDVVYGAIPAAVKFVGEPFAKLVDKLGDTNIATEALDKVTQFADRPIGKAFGITNDPAYNAEAATRMMDYVGKNMDKGADYIAKETGLPKSDVSWFMNAALIAAGPAAYKGGKKAYEANKELVGEAVVKGKEAVGTVKEALQNKFESLRPQEDFATRSVGSAELPMIEQRRLRAAELPFPIEMEKSQLTRNPADVRFARETTKDPVYGQPFQEKYAQQNELIQRNLDQFVVDTGAELTGAQPATVGLPLRNTIKQARKTASEGVTEAYKVAKENGQMAELVDATPLKDYVGSLEAEAINAPVISSAEIKIKNLIDKDGGISLNNIEEVRKMVGRLSQDSSANAYFGKEINKIIDQVTEGKGGDLYKEARAKNTAFKNQFDDVPVIQTILNTKPGTKQHSVAVEDLVDKVMIKGSAEDVTNLFKTLDNAGPQGQQMINEMVGYVAEKIKTEATKGVQRDINGKPYVETRSLDTIINQLDKSGKLDLLFGAKGAEQYRTLNDVTKDLQTVPKDTTNPSGTSSSLLAAVAALGTETAANAMMSSGYFPVPIATGGALIGKHLYNKKVAKEKFNKISEFINYGKENP
jgi:hypothetical protein